MFNASADEAKKILAKKLKAIASGHSIEDFTFRWRCSILNDSKEDVYQIFDYKKVYKKLPEYQHH